MNMEVRNAIDRCEDLINEVAMNTLGREKLLESIEEVRSAVRGMDNVHIPTPVGDIILEEYGSLNSFPGVTAFFQPDKSVAYHQLAVVEYDTDRRRIQAMLWNTDREDPVFKVAW